MRSPLQGRLRWRRNPCELVDFERADHSFFNFNVSHKNFELTLAAADRFLVDRGLLPPEDHAEVDSSRVLSSGVAQQRLFGQSPLLYFVY